MKSLPKAIDGLFDHLPAALHWQLGRPIAVALTVLSVILVILPAHPVFPGLRNAQFDHYQRQWPRDRRDVYAVIVGIDDATLKAYGQWPWPRSLVASLVRKIQSGQPQAIGVDLIFAEPDRYGAAQLAHIYPELDPRTLNKLPDPDTDLAMALGEGPAPVVLGISGSETRLGTDSPLHHSVPLLFKGQGAHIKHFDGAIASLPIIAKATAGEALLNAATRLDVLGTEAGITRRMSTIGQINNATVATLSVEMIRQALGAPPLRIQLQKSEGNLLLGDYAIPLDADNNVALHFGKFQTDRFISAADILSGKQSPAIFSGRFVLIGLTGIGLIDQTVTPLGEKIPGVDIHAQLIESILSGDLLRESVWANDLAAALLVIGATLLVVLVPRLKPIYSGLLGLLVIAIMLGTGYLLFFFLHWLVDTATPALETTLVFGVLMIINADRLRREAALEHEASIRFEGELTAASRIQLGMLPDPAIALAGDPRADIAACLEAARSVGGDYYDCFRLDNDHLCLAIADVSGKGLPASLFMAVSKTLSGALLRQTSGNLEQAMADLNAELARENPEYLFVTAFVAVANLSTGIFRFACAGHEPPLLRRGNTVTRLECESVAGPPLCVLDDFVYPIAEIQLEPGDTLCLFTDGASEASDGKDFHGIDRMMQVMADLPSGAPAQHHLAAQRSSVRAFEAGHPASDDLTLLIYQFN